MASGICVVATKSGGNPEAVVDGETGLLVPPGDSLAIANAVIQILKNSTLAKEMGINGRKRVEKCFTFDKMISEMENLYLSLLKIDSKSKKSSENFLYQPN